MSQNKKLLFFNVVSDCSQNMTGILLSLYINKHPVQLLIQDDVAKGLVHLPKRAITAEVDLRRDGVKSDAVLDVSQQSSVCFSVTGGQQYNENRVNLCEILCKAFTDYNPIDVVLSDIRHLFLQGKCSVLYVDAMVIRRLFSMPKTIYSSSKALAPQSMKLRLKNETEDKVDDVVGIEMRHMLKFGSLDEAGDGPALTEEERESDIMCEKFTDSNPTDAVLNDIRHLFLLEKCHVPCVDAMAMHRLFSMPNQVHRSCEVLDPQSMKWIFRKETKDTIDDFDGMEMKHLFRSGCLNEAGDAPSETEQEKEKDAKQETLDEFIIRIVKESATEVADEQTALCNHPSTPDVGPADDQLSDFIIKVIYETACEIWPPTSQAVTISTVAEVHADEEGNTVTRTYKPPAINVTKSVKSSAVVNIEDSIELIESVEIPRPPKSASRARRVWKQVRKGFRRLLCCCRSQAAD